MGMRCHFVIAATLISQARTEDKMDEQLQLYLEMRKHITAYEQSFERLFQDLPTSADEQAIGDLAAKMSTLFVFDFEAATCLKNWDQLAQIVRRAKLCRDETMLKAMGDCLLRSQAPGQGTAIAIHPHTPNEWSIH